MSIILSIETSSELASAALLVGQHVTQRQTTGVTNHSHAILPMVQSLLAEAGLCLSDCDAIALGEGPGSFTGVRTACGVVQGLAFGTGLPVIPVVTLLALAEACRRATGAVHVLTALDARMGEIYWAQYYYAHGEGVTGGWQVVSAPALCAPSMLIPVPTSESGSFTGLRLYGSGFAAYQDQFLLSAGLMATAQQALPEASALAWLADIEFNAGHCLGAGQAQPLYLRNKIALTIAERRAAAELKKS